MTKPMDAFGARATLEVGAKKYTYYRLGALENQNLCRLEELPYSIRILLESLLRNVDDFVVSSDDVKQLAKWDAENVAQRELPFLPGRVVLQDFTGVPCVVDLAAMRDVMAKLGGDPKTINPLVPCDLVIDHSVQVDSFARPDSAAINTEREFARNKERYEFLKWGQQSFSNFSVVPPATGIVHQVNLEYLAPGALTRNVDGDTLVFPDSLVGTDSHTTMINGLGVVGWGVGGIEAEAVMLGQPVYMLTPEVIGFRLAGKLAEGTTATDLVLTVTEMLRSRGVVGKFVEFFGSGMASMSLPDRATIANMAPEYGATMGFFPIDRIALEYLKLSGRSDEQVALTEAYTRANHLFWSPDQPEPKYTDVMELDLSKVEPSLAGPKRPQDRVLLSKMKQEFRRALTAPAGPQGIGVDPAKLDDVVTVEHSEQSWPAEPGIESELRHGALVIAAITSCTNTSNPDVMLAAGLVARKARSFGLTRKPWVKTSLGPGSKVVSEYFDRAGLSEDLEAIGFHLVGYGCTTCIGNSGPLPDEIDAALRSSNIVATSVLSGNRNFEGRVHALTKANYLASPPLVVAYALAGTVDIDLSTEPIAQNADGRDVYLADIWPTQEEVRALRTECIGPEQFRASYGDVFSGNATWNAVPVSKSDLYPWSDDSTYIQNPPFFEGMQVEAEAIAPIKGARCLAHLGDTVTTDHISPAGAIPKDGPAGLFLISKGVDPADFNSFGSRRGNDRVMTRGTFANIRVRNKLAPGTEGGYTTDFTQGSEVGSVVTSIYEAAENYAKRKIPLIVLGGKDYGMGSSRDWAAKGTTLLGVRAVITESFERIHRSNLVGMGVLPLNFLPGENAESLGLDGSEIFDIEIPETIEPGCTITVRATHPSGSTTSFETRCRMDTPVEIEYYRNGGILQTVIRKLL